MVENKGRRKNGEKKETSEIKAKGEREKNKRERG